MSISLITLALAKKYSKKEIMENTLAIDQKIIDAITESKNYTDSAISQVTSFNVKIVETLPLVNIDPHTIYFVKRVTPSGEVDYYYEFMFIDNKWEIIGSTELDLTGYWTAEETIEYINSRQYSLPIASDTTLGGVMVDNDTISISSEGIISVDREYAEENAKKMAQEVIEDERYSITNKEIIDLFDKNNSNDNQ